MNKTKAERYNELVAKFKTHYFSDQQLVNPHFIEGFDFDVINPWELWHNNLNAEIMFIGQDFSDTASLRLNLQNDWEKEKKTLTNLRVVDFFSILGGRCFFEGVNYSAKKKISPLIFTNAVLGIKQSEFDTNKIEKENMSKSVKENWHGKTSEYLEDMIAIVEPKYIIAMGKSAYRAICHIYGMKPKKTMSEVIGYPIPLNNNQNLFVVQHCSGLGLRTRSLTQQCNDWMTIRDIIDPNY